MDEEPDLEEPTGPPSSVLGGRLAGDLEGNAAPTLKGLGLEAAKDVAFDWQQQRSRARSTEMRVLLHDPASSEWVREIHGLIGVVGELILVCVEAEVEKEILVRRLAGLPSDTTLDLASRAAASRSLRFFAEGQGNQLTVAGHTLANLTLRTLTLHPGFVIGSVARALGIKVAQYTPRSMTRQAWTSLTIEKAAVMRAAAATLGCPELVTLTEALQAIAGDPGIVDLKNLRNEQYHRWRGESPGVTGVNFNEDSMVAKLKRREAVGFGRELLPEYVDGQAVLDDVVRVARLALDALVAQMPSFLDKWHAGFIAATA